MRIGILGTRGIPATYGGFETFAEELSWRLAENGHDVTVYCRSHHTPSNLREHRGVRLVVLPTIRHKYLDTVVHTFVSALHSIRGRFDVVLVCNAANALFVPIIKLSGAPVALNVDGIERMRKKWNRLGKSFYGFAERVSCRVADVLVSDARVIQEYYRDVHRTRSVFIPYGPSTEETSTREALDRFGLEPGGYWLYVSRFEPENNAHVVLEAFNHQCYDRRLVMVGDAPYAVDYVRRLKEMAGKHVLFTGYVFGQGYRELVRHAYGYIQATEVGGTHPALIESMGAGNGVIVADTPENREVAADGAWFFPLSDPGELARAVRKAEKDPAAFGAVAERGRARVRERYSWESVTDAYERLFTALAGRDATTIDREMTASESRS
jgi:glycosyltransferase involved in cell wall biosynthesis